MRAASGRSALSLWQKWGRNFGTGLAAAWSEFYNCKFEEFPLAFFENLLCQEFSCNGWGVLWWTTRITRKA